MQQVRFEKSSSPYSLNIQPLEDGWLIGERWGSYGLYDRAGARRKTLDLGDRTADIQTTRDGRIWVSCFNGGRFGRGIGEDGVVCFDMKGKPLFRYGQFAEQKGLPFDDDLYGMNVDASGEVWLNYFAGLPLIHLKDEAIEEEWLQFGYLGSGFGVRNGSQSFQKAQSSWPDHSCHRTSQSTWSVVTKMVPW